MRMTTETIEVKALTAVELSTELVEISEAVEASENQHRLVVLANDTRTRIKRGTLDIYHIGANLLEAQSLLGHGDFLPWIATEFDMSQSSAYRFMEVGRAFQDKLPNLGNFEIAASALYQLASPSTPEAARNEALELAASGEVITAGKAKEILEKHTPVDRKPRATTQSSDRGGDVLPDIKDESTVEHLSKATKQESQQKPNLASDPKLSPGDIVRRISDEHGEEFEVIRVAWTGDNPSLIAKIRNDYQDPQPVWNLFLDKIELVSKAALPSHEEIKKYASAGSLSSLIDCLPVSELGLLHHVLQSKVDPAWDK